MKVTKTVGFNLEHTRAIRLDHALRELNGGTLPAFEVFDAEMVLLDRVSPADGTPETAAEIVARRLQSATRGVLVRLTGHVTDFMKRTVYQGQTEWEYEVSK